MRTRRFALAFLLVILTVAVPTSTAGCGDTTMPLFCSANGHVCAESAECCSNHCALTNNTTPPSGTCTTGP